MPAQLIAGLLRRDRAVTVAALAAVIAAAWAYLVLGTGRDISMMAMGGAMAGASAMAMHPEWTLGYALLIFLMWVVMMAAMMLPSAAPTVLLVDALARRRTAGSGFTTATALMFASGYLLVWCGFSLAATVVQGALARAGTLSAEMAIANAAIVAIVVIAAGIYQWTPLKAACLRHCQSPLGFLVRHWRGGGSAAVATGMRHGAYCLGCCWMLMVLLFVAGVMNLVWIAAVALLVLVEKVIPWGRWTSRLSGGLLVLWGAVELMRNL